MKTVCLYQADSHLEALAMKEELETRGVVCIMPNEHLSAVVPFYTSATGGYRLFVSESALDDALGILETILETDSIGSSSTTTAETTPAAGVEICPRCRGSHTRFDKKPRRGLIISLMILFFIPVPAYITRYVCLDCGYRWKKRKG